MTVAKYRPTQEDHGVDGLTVFNTSKVDATKQPMFFGKPLGIQRYDKFRYPVFYKLTQQQMGYFWRPEEVDLQKDRADFQTLSNSQKHIFTSNLKYQILLDSVQGRGPGMAFMPYCSLPELESAMNAWQFMEMVHSYSYSHIIANVYPDSTKEFDAILDEPMILKRAESVTKAYDEFLDSAHLFDNSNAWRHALEGVPVAQEQLYELKRKLYKAVVNVNVLEGIRFYVSFACSFAFGENKLMEGNAKIIGLIARDESQHLVITQNILKKWADGDDPDMVSIMEEEKDNVIQMFKTCVDEEKRWAEYLFKDGSMIGLNAKLLSMYVEWIANRRMKAIGFKPIYDIAAVNNPLPWTEHWLNSDSLQVAPQETEVESYVIGGINQDIDKNAISGFKL